MNNNNSNNTIIHIPTCGLWSSCHLASLVLPAPGTHPHIHTAHSPPTLLYVCAAAAVGWCISPYFSSVVSGGRASRATIHTYILLLLLSNGPIHGIKWSLSVRARALTLTVVAKREEDGARGQSSTSEQCRDSHREQRSRPTIFYCFGRPDQNKPEVDSLQGRYGSCNPTLPIPLMVSIRVTGYLRVVGSSSAENMWLLFS